MRLGTKSLLFGAHCIIIHPIALAVAWNKLYGFPWHPALWLAFVVHDWGYWGKPNMDGDEGTRHPELGASIVGKFFGTAWSEFTLCHSRRYAQLMGCEVSQLCVADKLSTVIMPTWLYLMLIRASGEIREYRQGAGCNEPEEYLELVKDAKTDGDWFNGLKVYSRRVIERTKGSALSIRDFRALYPYK